MLTTFVEIYGLHDPFTSRTIRTIFLWVGIKACNRWYMVCNPIINLDSRPISPFPFFPLNPTFCPTPFDILGPAAGSETPRLSYSVANPSGWGRTTEKFRRITSSEVSEGCLVSGRRGLKGASYGVDPFTESCGARFRVGFAPSPLLPLRMTV